MVYQTRASCAHILKTFVELTVKTAINHATLNVNFVTF